MAEPAAGTPRIDDPRFARAVALIDAGETSGLAALLDAHRDLLTMRAEEDGSFAGPYFARPYLLWFVAENPIRRGTLPGNIADVARVITEASLRHGVAGLQDRLDYTLSLVASGCVPREAGVQPGLLETLVEAGADPGGALPAALAEREPEAVQTLLRLGAEADLATAACLGGHAAVDAAFAAADDDQRRRALALAALWGDRRSIEILVDRGVDPDFHNPEGCHAHATPLHNAVSGGHAEAVAALVTRGADVSLRDKLWNGTPADWAAHAGHADLAQTLREAERPS